jgi:hypothetical protein
MPHILIVTFDFPPSNRVAVHRSLSNANYLMEQGWDVSVLTVKSNCYEIVDENLYYPESLKRKTYRTSALDSKKIGFKGKYIDFLTIPDEWISWLAPGVFKGRSIIQQNRPDVIWSTCPPFTPHLIAGILSRAFNVPWVADYRDPVIEGLHGLGVIGQSWGILKTDRFVVNSASKLTFATAESRGLYVKRYPNSDSNKFVEVSNGYYDLPDVDKSSYSNEHPCSRIVKVLYSGSLYGARDPSPIFEAIMTLKAKGKINDGNFSLVFQGAGFNKAFHELVAEFDIDDIVTVEPAVGFKESIAEMKAASALLLIQGEGFNLQVPAKAYEYIAAQKPIIGLCDAKGATAKLLKKIPYAYTAENSDDVINVLEKLLLGDVTGSDGFDYSQYSRSSSANQLERILKGCIAANDL